MSNEWPVPGMQHGAGSRVSWVISLGQMTWPVNAVVIRQGDVMVMGDLVGCSEYLQDLRTNLAEIEVLQSHLQLVNTHYPLHLA